MFWYYGGNDGRGSGAGVVPPEELASTVAVYYADNPENVTYDVDLDFSPTDVDISTNELLIVEPLFSRNSVYKATPVWFTTTGTLPAPLNVDEKYIAQTSANGVILYPWNDEDDYASLPGYVEGETVTPAQSYFFELNQIDLTTQGSGTHTLHANILCSEVADSGDGGYKVTTPVAYNSMMELETDAHGVYIKQRGALARRTTKPPNADDYGKIANLSSGKIEMATELTKRFLYTLVVARTYPYQYVAPRRVVPTSLNAGTGVHTFSTHTFSTGQEVDKGTYPGGTLPGGMNGAVTSFIRMVSANTFTLHPSAADASANTNKETYSDTGTGPYWIRGVRNIAQTSPNMYFLDVAYPNGDQHMMNPSTNQSATTRDCASHVTVSGSSNGRWSGIFTNSDLTNPVVQVRLWAPPGTTLPTRQDTGLPMTLGTYWYAKAVPLGSTSGRLHDSEAAALADVGVSDASSSCIKYSSAGEGICVFYIDDGNCEYGCQTYPNKSFPGLQSRGPKNTLGAWVTMVDTANGVGTAPVWHGLNGVGNLVTGTFDGNFSEAKMTPSSSFYFNFFNAPEPHTMGFLDMYAAVIGASDTDPTSEIESIIEFMQSKYNF